RRSRRPVVDLPQPLSPTSASVSPRATVKLRSSTALTAPRLRPKKPDLTWKCLTSFSTRSSGPSVLAIDAGAAARALIGARLGRGDSLPPCGGGAWGEGGARWAGPPPPPPPHRAGGRCRRQRRPLPYRLWRAPPPPPPRRSQHVPLERRPPAGGEVPRLDFRKRRLGYPAGVD